MSRLVKLLSELVVLFVTNCDRVTCSKSSLITSSIKVESVLYCVISADLTVKLISRRLKSLSEAFIQ